MRLRGLLTALDVRIAVCFSGVVGEDDTLMTACDLRPIDVGLALPIFVCSDIERELGIERGIVVDTERQFQSSCQSEK